MAAPSPRITTRDRLSSTLFLAAVLHGVLIMGVTFSVLPPAPSQSTLLRVTMVSEAADTPDPDAVELAQAAARGSGTDGARRSAGARPEPRAPAESGEFADRETAAPGQRQPRPESLSARENDARRRIAVRDPAERVAAAPRDAAPAVQPPRPATRLATPDLELEARGEQRELVVGADTRASQVAPYLAAWKWHVERVGTANFPAGARASRAARNPVLEVAIGADGRLHDIVVVRSSGDAFLDRAALQILRMSAPFEAFPESLRAEYDVLRFAYEWQFAPHEAPAAGW